MRDDIHGLEVGDRPGLTLFMAGNQFMVMPELADAFRKENIGAETIVYQIPPGLELRQILAGGACFRGKTYKFRSDVYSSVSEKAMKALAERDNINLEDYFVYLHNRLTLMVRQGNHRALSFVGNELPTAVHHGETPIRLLQGEADVGPVWYTEIEEVKRAGLEIEGVELAPPLIRGRRSTII